MSQEGNLTGSGRYIDISWMLHAPPTMRPADRITPKDDNAETPEEFVQKLPPDCKRQCALACVLFFTPCHPFRPGSGFTLRGAQWVMRNVTHRHPHAPALKSP